MSKCVVSLCDQLILFMHFQHNRPDGPMVGAVYPDGETDAKLNAQLLEPYINQARKHLHNTHGCIVAIVDNEDIPTVQSVMKAAGLHLHFRFLCGHLDYPSDGRLSKKPYFEVSKVPLKHCFLVLLMK
jgi:hypothetical protein